MKILMTGCAGFIGMHLSKKLVKHNEIIEDIKSIKIIKLISLIEKSLSIKTKINFLKVLNIEAYKTSADILKLKRLSSHNKKTSIEKRILNFVN
jgi:UDP-glucose 4-epimerase